MSFALTGIVWFVKVILPSRVVVVNVVCMWMMII